MQQINLQIRVPAEFVKEMEHFSSLSRSDFVRVAIQEKLDKLRAEQMEGQWIKALGKSPESKNEAEAWHRAEDWE